MTERKDWPEPKYGWLEDIVSYCYILSQFVYFMAELSRCLGQFSFQRRDKEKVQQNKISGDCGVFACKILECILLGITFVSISDANI